MDWASVINLLAAIALPSCAICSRLTKARSQRGIRVVSGAGGGARYHAGRRGC